MSSDELFTQHAKVNVTQMKNYPMTAEQTIKVMLLSCD